MSADVEPANQPTVSTFTVGTLTLPITFFPTGGPMAKKAVRRPRRRTQLRKKKTIKYPPYALSTHSKANTLFGGPIFNIFPSNYPSPQLNIYMSMMTISIKQRIQFLKSIRQQLSRFTTPSSVPALPAPLPWSPKLSSAIMVTHTKLVRIRARFRKFLHLWRYKNLKTASEEDPVTCEAPVHPITVVDWKTKTRYLFEASTLMRDITNRLLTHDGFFDTAQAPRNPYTNEPFTLAQMVSIWNQLSRSPEPASWAFTCFASSQFNLKTFTAEYTIPLQLNALRVTMADPADLDQQERLLDFIDYEHEIANIPYYKTAYSYAVTHHQDESRMVAWRVLCTEYYEAHIKFQHNQFIMKQLHQQIHDKCQPHMTKPAELIQLYKDAVRSAPPPPSPPPNPFEEDEAVISLDILTFFSAMNMMNPNAVLETLLTPPPPPVIVPAPPASVAVIPLNADDVSEAIELALATALSLQPSTEEN